MSLQVLHLVGTSLARLGWLTAIMSCGLPMWRVTFPESETEVDVSIWEGLWHMCEVRGLGSMQCMSYRHRLAIPEDLHVSQVLMIVSIIISGLLFPLCVAVGECSSWVKNQIIGARLARWEAAMVLVSGLLLLASVSWITHNFDYSFYNPVLGSRQRTQLGASPYLGWVGSGLMLLGGACSGARVKPTRTSPLTLKSLLTYLLLPATVRDVGHSAFWVCSSLTELRPSCDLTPPLFPLK